MDDLPVVEFADAPALRVWLKRHHETSAGVWLRIYKKRAAVTTVSFQETGTTSERHRSLAERLIAEGQMTPAGRIALGLDPVTPDGTS